MSGHGGHKHRSMAKHHKRQQKLAKAKASIAKGRGIFEAKGQAWDPKNNPAQLAVLTHDARRLVLQSEYKQF